MRSSWKITWILVALSTGCATSGMPWAKQEPAPNSFGATTAPVAQASWTEKIAAPFTSKDDKKPAPDTSLKTDPISLQFGSGPPSAALYLSMAQLSDQGGNVDQARSLYQKALSMEPKNTDCLLGLARLEDREGKMQAALPLYQKVVDQNPQDPSALNDLALCLARNGQINDCLQLLDKAVRMQPDKQLYRNNIAKVWIETNRLDLAIAHLKAVYEPSYANYNMAVLLHQRGRNDEAVAYLNTSLAEKSDFADAKTLMASLNPTAPQLAQQSSANHQAIQVSAPVGTRYTPASNDDILPTPMFPPNQSAGTQYPSTGAQPMIPQPQNFPAETASMPVGSAPLSFPPVR